MTTPDVYRTADRDAEVEALKARVRELEAERDAATSGLVPFGTKCPYCGSNARMVVATGEDAKTREKTVKVRRFVPARPARWWRRARPAHLVSTCAECMAEIREAPKGSRGTSGGDDE